MPGTVSIYTTLGALEIGVIIGLFLFGISTAQVSIYYQRFPQDPLNIKALVAIVWILDVGHSILISCLVYTLTVAYYGRPDDLNKFTCLNTIILFGSAITWTEQVFFSYRIYKIMDRSILGVICFTLSTARFIACIVLAVGAYKEPTFRSLKTDYAWLMTTVLVASACVDVIIAASLCYFLVHRRDNNLERTTKVLDRLIAWTLQTGLITSITASSMVICFQTMPNNYIWLGIYMFLGKLYSNSLLASLNNRMNLRSTMAKVSRLRAIRSSVAPATFNGSQAIPPTISFGIPPTSPQELTEKSKHDYDLLQKHEDADTIVLTPVVH